MYIWNFAEALSCSTDERAAVEPDALRALRAHEGDARFEPRDARNVVRPCLQTVGKKVRHALTQRFAACAALNERERVAATEQQPRPLRAVKSFMPRHGKECGRERGKVDRQRARGLRRVDDERHACAAAELRDALNW